MTDTFEITVDFPRDRWRRPLVKVSDDKMEPYARPSGFGEVLEDKSGLTTWKIRTAINGCVDRPDLLNLYSAYRTNDKKTRELVELFLEAGGASQAANTGTAIHDILAQVNRGDLTVSDVPERFRQYVDAWLDALNTHGFEVIPKLIERHLVNDTYRTAGSGDVFLRRKSDGKIFAVDVKTGKTISARPLGYMVQLYLYATSDLYDVITGEREAFEKYYGTVSTDVAYIAHIPANGVGCVFYEVDLHEAKILTDLAAEVRRVGKEIQKVIKLDAPVAEITSLPSIDEFTGDLLIKERRNWCRHRLAELFDNYPQAKDMVVRNWPTGVPGFRGEYLHSDAELDLIVHVLDRVETEYHVPFGATDPKVIAAQQESGRAVRIVKQVFPDATLVDDDSDIDERTYKEFKTLVSSMPSDQQAWIAERTKEASSAKKSISLSQNRTVRRFQIAQALVRLSEFHDADDVVRAFIQLVAPEMNPTSKIGAVLGGLTLDQALRLQKISDAIDTGVLTLSWDENQQPIVLGDMSVISTD